MKLHRRMLSVLAAAAVAASLATPALASRQPVPRGGGGAHSSAPSHGTAHGTATRGTVPPRTTAHGTAHYGYGGYSGYPYYGWWGNPWYGWWGPGWSIGFDAWWGWPYYEGYYGPYYGPYTYGPTYVIAGGEARGPAIVETDVTPKSAQVILDGTPVGYAKDYNGRWDELTVSPGRHKLEFREAGHRSLVVELDAAPGARYTIDRDLAAGSGEDRVSVGPPKGEAPAASAAAPAATSGMPRGLLRLRVMPEDAGIYLDGEFLGLASEIGHLHGAIPVASGEHRIEVVRPGFAGQVKTVDVGTSAPVEVSIELTKN